MPTPTAPTPFTKVHRLPDRADYDRTAVHAVLDAATIAHVGLVRDERPVVIPLLFGRHDDALYLHGSVAGGVMRDGGAGSELCLTATVVDGLVLARSAFHHSMNYRSVVVIGRPEPVAGDEKLLALRTIAEHLTPGRWDEVRPPTEVELRQTAVLRLGLDEASTKCRAAGPADDEADLDLPVWAGVVPMFTGYGTPQPADDLGREVGPSPAAARLVASGGMGVTPR
jgi:uncharacterized protein